MQDIVDSMGVVNVTVDGATKAINLGELYDSVLQAWPMYHPMLMMDLVRQGIEYMTGTVHTLYITTTGQNTVFFNISRFSQSEFETQLRDCLMPDAYFMVHVWDKSKMFR